MLGQAWPVGRAPAKGAATPSEERNIPKGRTWNHQGTLGSSRSAELSRASGGGPPPPAGAALCLRHGNGSTPHSLPLPSAGCSLRDPRNGGLRPCCPMPLPPASTSVLHVRCWCSCNCGRAVSIGPAWCKPPPPLQGLAPRRCTCCCASCWGQPSGLPLLLRSLLARPHLCCPRLHQLVPLGLHERQHVIGRVGVCIKRHMEGKNEGGRGGDAWPGHNSWNAARAPAGSYAGHAPKRGSCRNPGTPARRLAAAGARTLGAGAAVGGEVVHHAIPAPVINRGAAVQQQEAVKFGRDYAVRLMDGGADLPRGRGQRQQRASAAAEGGPTRQQPAGRLACRVAGW